MRSKEERVRAVRLRAAQMKKQQRRRNLAIASIGSVAASFAVILTLAFWMPETVERVSVGDSQNYAGTASIFGESVYLGYVVIGILAFSLGICVTLLCIRLHQLSKEEKDWQND